MNPITFDSESLDEKVRVKRIMFPLAILMLQVYAGKAQDRERFLPLKPKPIITLSAEINKYWNFGSPEDTLAPIQKEHFAAMNEGRRYAFSLAVHPIPTLCFGLQYSHAHTAHATPEAHWLVNNVPRYGSISESIYQNMYGGFVQKYFEITSEYMVGFGFSPSIVSYVQYSDFAGEDFILQGLDLAIDLNLDGVFVMDHNWSAYVRAAYCSAAIAVPLYSDDTFSREPLIGHPIPLSNLRVGVGIRYSFVKKPKVNGREKLPMRTFNKKLFGRF